MNKLYITRGIQASGKTTYAKKMLEDNDNLVRINRDDLRSMLFGGWTGEHSDEELVTRVQHDAIRSALRKERDVICDDTHLRRKYVKRMYELAKEEQAEFVLLDHFMQTDVEELVARNAQRETTVSEDLIRKNYRTFSRELDLSFMQEEQSVKQRYIADLSLPSAILVDIDGTVALHDGVRSPYDTTMYHLDRVNYPVVAVIDGFVVGHNAYADQVKVIFMSGRHSDFYGETYNWLEDNMPFAFEELIMRDDDRQHPMRDDAMKLSLFDRFVRDRYNVIAVFDDRDRVVDMWRSIGLTVLQVAEGDF